MPENNNDFFVEVGSTSSINSNGTTTATTSIDMWSLPVFIKALEVGETVEFIYKQSSMISYTTYPSTSPSDRVFKIVFSCINGKWNKSEPIYGKIIPPSEESYEFDE